jgi:hypothetical protein
MTNQDFKLSLEFDYELLPLADGFSAFNRRYNRHGIGKTRQEAVQNLSDELMRYFEAMHDDRILYFTGLTTGTASQYKLNATSRGF